MQDTERLKFTAHERDLHSLSGAGDDIDYMHARYYGPMVGRFLSPDPLIGDPEAPQSWNRYAYVMGNPTNYIDPYGLAFSPFFSPQLEYLIWAYANSDEITVIGEAATYYTGLQGLADLLSGWRSLGSLGDTLSNWVDRVKANTVQYRQPDYWYINGEFKRAEISWDDLAAAAAVVAAAISVNQANQQVHRGQAPDSVERVDKGRGPYEQDHVHLTGGHALNKDGSWKHGSRPLTAKEKEWLTSIGWGLPPGE